MRRERIMNGEYSDTWQRAVQMFPMGSPGYREAMNKIREEDLKSYQCASQLNYAGSRAAEARRNHVEKGLQLRHGRLG
jgi:hypothetical protein